MGFRKLTLLSFIALSLLRSSATFAQYTNFGTSIYGVPYTGAASEPGLYTACRVKIGTGMTNYPVGQLDVWGTTILNGDKNGVNLGWTVAQGNKNIPGADLTKYFPTNNGRLLIGWNRTNAEGEADFISNRGAGSQGGFAFYDYHRPTSTTASEKMLMRLMANGNIGIGNINPPQLLSLRSDCPRIAFQSNSTVSTVYTGMIEYWPTESQFRFQQWNNAGTVWQNTIMAVDLKNLNVGIGTTTPSPKYKLDVAGSIRAKEIKVELAAGTLPDFVFKPDYNLRKLDEVESFIKKNGHLPEIPSAKEVEKNGLAVGEMQAKLLQKVEELTLYVIDIKKENAALKAEIEKLK
jgi:hypothetical protein